MKLLQSEEESARESRVVQERETNQGEHRHHDLTVSMQTIGRFKRLCCDKVGRILIIRTCLQSEERARRKMVRERISELPGKLDHASVVAYRVGSTNGNNKTKYRKNRTH